MHEAQINIENTSSWKSATPTAAAVATGYAATECGHFVAKQDYYTKRSDKEEYLLLYTVRGTGRVELENYSCDLPPHTAILLDCRSYQLYKTVGREWEFFWVHLIGSGVEGYFKMLEISTKHEVTVSNPQEYMRSFNELFESFTKSDLENASKSSLAIHRLLSVVAQQADSQGQLIDIERLADYIQKNHARPLTVDEMADAVHLSKYYFIRVFKRIYGVTPYRYLLGCRINQAKIYLRTTDMSVSEISEKVGFSDESNFIDKFRSHTDITPTEYRRDFSSNV